MTFAIETGTILLLEFSELPGEVVVAAVVVVVVVVVAAGGLSGMIFLMFPAPPRPPAR